MTLNLGDMKLTQTQIFPCKLDEFIKLNEDADRHNWFNGKKSTCHGCGKEQDKQLMACNGCKLVSYCSKVSKHIHTTPKRNLHLPRIGNFALFSKIL